MLLSHNRDLNLLKSEAMWIDARIVIQALLGNQGCEGFPLTNLNFKVVIEYITMWKTIERD